MVDPACRAARSYGSDTCRNPAQQLLPLGLALDRGLAPDGGLYVPERLPAAEPERLARARTLPELALWLLSPFAEGDVLESALGSITAEAFDFAAPVTDVDRASTPLSVLELFHGPTAAFKDFGARFLAAALERLPPLHSARRTILVATSGDTGGADTSSRDASNRYWCSRRPGGWN